MAKMTYLRNKGNQLKRQGKLTGIVEDNLEVLSHQQKKEKNFLIKYITDDYMRRQMNLDTQQA